jgi:hypothetical protein
METFLKNPVFAYPERYRSASMEPDCNNRSLEPILRQYNPVKFSTPFPFNAYFNIKSPSTLRPPPPYVVSFLQDFRSHLYVPITILNIIHRPISYLKQTFSETGFCLRFQPEPIHLELNRWS